jgi:hypothetical protein
MKTFESVQEWKTEIKRVFKVHGYSEMEQNIQANAFEEMFLGDKVSDLPCPTECYDAEMSAANS